MSNLAGLEKIVIHNDDVPIPDSQQLTIVSTIRQVWKDHHYAGQCEIVLGPVTYHCRTEKPANTVKPIDTVNPPVNPPSPEPIGRGRGRGRGRGFFDWA